MNFFKKIVAISSDAAKIKVYERVLGDAYTVIETLTNLLSKTNLGVMEPEKVTEIQDEIKDSLENLGQTRQFLKESSVDQNLVAAATLMTENMESVSTNLSACISSSLALVPRSDQHFDITTVQNLCENGMVMMPSGTVKMLFQGAVELTARSFEEKVDHLQTKVELAESRQQTAESETKGFKTEVQLAQLQKENAEMLVHGYKQEIVALQEEMARLKAGVSSGQSSFSTPEGARRSRSASARHGRHVNSGFSGGSSDATPENVLVVNKSSRKQKPQEVSLSATFGNEIYWKSPEIDERHSDASRTFSQNSYVKAASSHDFRPSQGRALNSASSTAQPPFIISEGKISVSFGQYTEVVDLTEKRNGLAISELVTELLNKNELRGLDATMHKSKLLNDLKRAFKQHGTFNTDL